MPCVSIVQSSPSTDLIGVSSRLVLSSQVSSLNASAGVSYQWDAVNVSVAGGSARALTWANDALALAQDRGLLLTSANRAIVALAPGALFGGATYDFTLLVTDSYGSNSATVRAPEKRLARRRV